MSQGVNGEGEDGMGCVYPEQVPSVTPRSLTVSPHCVWRRSTFPLHYTSAAFLSDIYITHSSYMVCCADCM